MQDQFPSLSWEELLPYIGRHVGMRPDAAAKFTFAIGEDFGPLPAGLSPAIDRHVAHVLKEHAAEIGSLLIQHIPGTIQRPRFNDTGEPLPYTDDEINSFAAALWQRVLAEDPPATLTRLRFLLARALAGKLQIKGMTLKPTLSSPTRANITWEEARPYVLGLIKVAWIPDRTDNGKPRLGLRICMTDNNLGGIPADEMDWRVAEVVLQALGGEMGRDSVFFARVNKHLSQLHRGPFSEAALARLKPEARKEQLAALQKLLEERLLNDEAWLLTVHGLLMHQFQAHNFPAYKPAK